MCFGNYTVSYAFYFLFTDGKLVASKPSMVTHAFNAMAPSQPYKG